MKYGFIKVAAAVPTVTVADCKQNVKEIENLIAQAEGQAVKVITFPELCITGYTCGDLFRQQLLLDAAENGVMQLLNFTRKLDIISIVGAPVVVGNLLLNCAVVIQQGRVLGIVPKTYLPNHNEFYEKRWFASSHDLHATEIHYAGCKVLVTPNMQLFHTCDGAIFGVEVCEDVWAPVPPSNDLALAGADIIFNLSASDEVTGKYNYLKGLLSQQSARTISGYVYASAGFGESSQDLVFGAKAIIYENGLLMEESERFSMESQLRISQIDIERLRGERRNNTTFTYAQRVVNYASVHHVEAEVTQNREFQLDRYVDPHPFMPHGMDAIQECDDIVNVQVLGLVKRLTHTYCRCAVLGISGGLDSTLALLVTVKAFDKLGYDRRGIIGVTMPGFGTSDRTHDNALALMDELGVTMREVSIAESVMKHFEDIGHDPAVHDVTYENAQARERTQILMDLANELGGMVIGTGDLSELALGWATYNGDHMSMYGVNASVPKTLIQHLVRHIAKAMDKRTAATLLDILDTPISPELTPADDQGNIKQKTEDLVGPYELHDFFLFYFLRYGFSPRKIYVLAQKAFQSNVEGAGCYDDETIKHWLKVFCRRFFNQQFKRSCLPDGPKVGVVSLSPRGDWRMPSDAVSTAWLEEVEAL